MGKYIEGYAQIEFVGENKKNGRYCIFRIKKNDKIIRYKCSNMPPYIWWAWKVWYLDVYTGRRIDDGVWIEAYTEDGETEITKIIAIDKSAQLEIFNIKKALLN